MYVFFGFVMAFWFGTIVYNPRTALEFPVKPSDTDFPELQTPRGMAQ